MITKNNRPEKLWVDKGTEIAGEFKKLPGWRNTNLLYNEWDQGCICWTYNTISEKNTLLLHGRQWVQVDSQIESFHYNIKF